jgi:2-polyprenyl-3-methyl-5-hydroxy-6-metoxy-1,4-benzoquinol methylase
MTVSENLLSDPDPYYQESLAGEGEYWDNYIAGRLLHHDEIPGSVDFRIFFSQYSRKHHWGPPCLGPIAINFRESEIRYVLTQATSVPAARVLDLGCGAGWLSLELARQGAHVTAVDISHSNLAIARHMATTNARNFPFLYQKFAGLPCQLERFGSVEYVYSDLNSIELPRQEYDAVVVWDSLHHIQNLERLLDQVRASLKPDGVFVGVDHAFATPLTIAYNEAVAPWLKEINEWLVRENPEWLYRAANELAGQYDWGVLYVDYDVGPIDGFEAFEAEVRDEILSIIRRRPGQDSIEGSKLANPARVDANTTHPAARTGGVEENISPFEDVSAEQVMRLLIDKFGVRHFRTICPLIQPEQYFAAPRSEPERIFQHYLSALIVKFNEQAITELRADGQWFLFHLTAGRPHPGDLAGNLSHVRSSTSVESIVRALEHSKSELTTKEARIAALESELATMHNAIGESTSYASQVEAELNRKNDALRILERRVEQLEKELTQARAPRLPWKRPSPK